MKINHPVTDQEVLMKKGTILVTRTNLKGIITYANDAFVEISGFSRKKLVGANHNVVRHPDMPPAAFEDLWTTIKAGKPWTAPVKNRTISGDYYWVEACVTPVYKNGRVHEYLSVRYAPSREQIRQAEDLYQQLNANKIQLRPKGLAAILKNIKEMAIWKKGAVMLTAFSLPEYYWLTQLYSQHDWPLFSTVLLLTTIATFIGISLIRKFTSTLKESIGILFNLSSESFRNTIDLDRNDQIGDFQRALYSMQIKLNADLSASRETSAEALRIKQALDNVSSCVMVANNHLDIIYMNKTVQAMFKHAEVDIQNQLPEFQADKLLGANIDQFHKNPAHQRGMLEKLESTLSSTLQIGGHHMDITVNPVKNDQGERVGIVVEWLDRSNEVKIENEVAEIVEAAKVGDISRRLDMSDKTGFFAKLGLGINALSDVIENGFADVNAAMQSIANGDLTEKIETDYQGVYLECKNHINNTIDKLSDMVGQINEAADFINNSSQEIASGNNNLSQRAEQQASALEETASSMEQLTSTVKNNTDNAQQANKLSANTRELAEKGGEVVSSAVAAMQDINESSNQIAEIIGVIDEIAFQTNLLALNASVEAARAGEQGRGFSVVATEVRNLAQRSATAARESKELIQNSVQKVRAGTEFVNETGKALNEIVGGVKKVGDIVAEIAAASVEQSAGISQVNQAVGEMDEITQQNAALAEQASAASVSMSDQSASMTQLLSFFKLDNRTKKAASVTQQSASAPETNKTTADDRPQQTPQPVDRNFSVGAADDNEWEEF